MKDSRRSCPRAAWPAVVASVPVLAAALLAAAPGIAAAEGDGPTSNVRLTIEVGRLEGGAKTSASSYSMIIAANGEWTSLSTGSRVPIPAGGTPPPRDEDAKAGPAPVFSYHDIGMNAHLSASLATRGGIQLRGSIESSYVLGGKPCPDPSLPPTIGQLREDVFVILRDGKPARLAAVEEPGRSIVYLDIKADLIE